MEGGCPTCTSVSYDQAYAFSHTSPQPNSLLHPFSHTLNLSTLTSYTLPHLPTLTPYSIPHLPLHMGANPGRMRDASPPRIRQHPPNTFNVQVAYRYSKLGISERDDLFLVFTSFWAKNWASATFCFFGLHFILTKNWAFADLSILLNHPPIAQHRFAPPPLHPQHLFPPGTPVSFD